MKKIIVCPNEEKMRILIKKNSSSSLEDITFFTKEEFFQQYYFRYDEKTFFYLMKKYGWHIDVVRTYLSYLYVVDEEKKYQNSKLQFLSQLKRELKENHYLQEFPLFSSFLKDKQIEVKNYYDLELYEEKALFYSPSFSDCSLDIPVYAFSTMEDEICFVCTEIIRLLKKGVELKKIILANVSEDYFYSLKKMFQYFHIPIQIPFHYSIYGNKIVQNYLNGKNLSFEDAPLEIQKKMVSILNELVDLDLEDSVGKEILLDKIEHTYFDYEEYQNAVQIKDLFKEEFAEDEYVFVMGFQQDVLPMIHKDMDYLTDSDKEEVDLYSTTDWNRREKKKTIFVLSHISHLYLSYKKESPFQKFYPSSLIKDLHLKEVVPDYHPYQYSHFYNQISLGEQLDQFFLYGEKNDSLAMLASSYKIPYRSYQSSFQGISKDLYLESLPYPLTLSYTSMNSYQECKFKYYVQNVLKLNRYEDTFSSFVGSMYHKILSLYRYPGFDFEAEYQKYIQERELSLKERLFLIKIRKELLSFIDVLRKQAQFSKYQDVMEEKRLEVTISRDVAVKFVGYVDKILYYKNVEDVYFSIIDYKTGAIDTHMEPMKYGLHMQLPVYLYLIHYSHLFSNPIFTGIYYQNILFPYPTWTPNLEKERKERYYLNGYSTDNIDVLERFDQTYQDSCFIKSLKYSSDKGFGTYSKILSEDMLYHLILFTKNKIEETVDEILDADFSINPKQYEQKNVSCLFCPYQDLCYHRESDYVYLDKVEDFSFLGGDC